MSTLWWSGAQHHTSLMIPVLDWRTVAIEHELMAPTVEYLERAGYDRALLGNAYGLLSPVEYSLPLPPQRVQLLYARHDQLTPEALTLRFAKSRGLCAIQAYDHSHATILLAGALPRHYRDFLVGMDARQVVSSSGCGSEQSW